MWSKTSDVMSANLHRKDPASRQKRTGRKPWSVKTTGRTSFQVAAASETHKEVLKNFRGEERGEEVVRFTAAKSRRAQDKMQATTAH